MSNPDMENKMKPNTSLRRAALFAALSATLFGALFCEQQSALAAGASAPLQTLALPADWYPESLATGPDGSFYVGSWHQGAVARVRPDGSAPEILVTPGSNGLANAQGILVDAAHQLLWVCSGNWGYTSVPSTPSALKSYDLVSGAPRASYAMPDKGYCNDLVQDSHGTLYVTDSFHPRVLRLLPGAAALSIWKEDPAMGVGNDGLYLNGIALDGDKRLYVSLLTAVPYVLRVDVDVEDNGAAGAVSRIEMPRVLKNADAIRIYAPNRMAIFESNAFGKTGPYGGQISIARINGNSASLDTIVNGLNDPSSGIIVGNRVYFTESKYGLLFAHKDHPEEVPANVPFDLQSRELPR
jgi:sugar lactone lactonase YvrE